MGTFTPPALPGFFAIPVPIAEPLPFASLPFLSVAQHTRRGSGPRQEATIPPGLKSSVLWFTRRRLRPRSGTGHSPLSRSVLLPAGKATPSASLNHYFRGSSDSVSYTSPRKPLPRLRLSPQAQIQGGLARSFPGEVFLPERRTISRSPAQHM